MRFVFCLLTILSVFTSNVAANVRAGAPRPLQSAGAFIAGTHVQSDGANLTFVRTKDARPMLWRATADPSNPRTPDWSTLPHREQSPYLLEVLSSQRKLSPDGKRLAYVSRRGGLEAIYVVPFGDIGREERARRVVTLARNPSWLDASTLLYENTRPGRSGLFRIIVSEDESARPAPQQLFPRGGETGVSPDGQTICLAALSEDTDATQLYLLAADGSGAQAIPETRGARRPAFSPDSRAIFYDAPAPQSPEYSATDAQRVLWMVPLQAKPPTAQLAFVREADNGDAEIVGTLYSGETGTLQSRIEFWPGDETSLKSPAHFVLPVKKAPIHNGVLVRWPLPRHAPGAPREWTLRLSAEGANGETSKSTLTFRWPPVAAATVPPLFAPTGALPVEDLPQVVDPAIISPKVVPVLPAPAATGQVRPNPNLSTPTRLAGALTSLPAPALPPAPEGTTQKSASPAPPPSPVSTPLPEPILDQPAKNIPPQAPTPKPPQKPKPVSQNPVSQNPVVPKPPAPKPQPTKTAPPKLAARKPQPPRQSGKGGIPAQMKVGTSTSVAVTLRNTGSRSWSSTGPSPVRLIVRWVNADSNTRHRWEVKWLRGTVAPGGSTKVNIDLEAPPKPGRYILTYALVRLSDQIYDGKSYKAPSTKASDHRWPGEFGAVSFDISVVP